jgi:hypothetical protein
MAGRDYQVPPVRVQPRAKNVSMGFGPKLQAAKIKGARD